MHVPLARNRAANVARLLVVFPWAVVVADRGRGVWDTARRAWGAMTGDRHLVLQDDATLTENFAARVLENPGPVSYCAAPSGYPDWIPAAVALCLPADDVRRWLAWADKQPSLQRRHDNVLLGRWLKRQGRTIPVEPLVTHGAFPSLLGHG
jgi:hypothetical protein